MLQHSEDSVNNENVDADIAVFEHPMGPQQPPLMIG